MSMNARAPVSLRQRALQYLAQREHTRQELRAKLLRWVEACEAIHRTCTPAVDGPPTLGPAPPPSVSHAEIDTLLDQLQQSGHLCDARFVESRVHARARRFGNLRIEHELRMHGAQAPAALRSELQASEFDRALAVWQRKFGRPPASAAERLRQMRFLAGRGFGAETIGRVMRHGGAREAQPFTDE